MRRPAGNGHNVASGEMMDLREFVTQTICDILGAVEDAQGRARGGQVVPNVLKSFKSVEAGISATQSVEFEIAVSTQKTTGGEIKLSVVAGLIGGGVRGQHGSGSGHVARLHFRVPIRFNEQGAKV